jgi:phosphoglycolate phosphatase
MHGFYRDAVFRLGRVYPGVTAALERWQGQGLKLACITNKASQFARPLLHDADLERYFCARYCADQRDQRKPSPSLLRQFMQDLAIEPQCCVMIGDSVHDMLAAEAAGMRAVAVTYGYGKPLTGGFSPWRTVDRLDELTLE